MSSTTSNMNLIVPSSGDDDYPTSFSSTFSSIDSHDHTTGKGVQIPTGGIQDLAVTTAKLQDLSVTTGKLADLSVTTAKIAANSVTRAKLATLNAALSTSSGSFNTPNTPGLVDVTNLSVSLTTSGRPVFLILLPDTAVTPAYIKIQANSFPSTGAQGKLALHRTPSASVLCEQELYLQADSSGSAALQLPPGILHYIDSPSAGTYTYKVQVQAAVSSSIYVEHCKLYAFEL